MKRGFKIVSSKKGQDIHLPQRQTTRAAGYDFEASEDFVLPSIWKGNFLKALWQIHQQKKLTDEELKAADSCLKPYLVPTGIKAYMQPVFYFTCKQRAILVCSTADRNNVVPFLPYI